MNRVRAIAIAVVFSSEGLLAQAPRGADTLSARAIADSQAVLRTLDAAVQANQKDAAAWYRRGMVAWALAERAAAKPPMRGLDATRLRRLADTSFRIAVELEPRRVEYQLGAGMFFRLSPEATARLAAVRFLDAAVEAARVGTDNGLLARTALEAGRVHWLRYDTDANQVLGCDTIAQSLDSASMALGGHLSTEVALVTAHKQIVNCLKSPHPPASGDYARAETLFREALGAMPDDARAFRQMAMLLADRDRWTELASTARDRTRRQPADAWAWLTLGLALHRSGKSDVASAIFDTGSARLGDRERGRLFAFTRVLTPRDSIAWSNANNAGREIREQSFWAMADPLWSRRGNDPRAEFLARVVFAELRWTVDELGVRGADSDRGEVHIRYGPPTVILALRGCHWWRLPGDTLLAPPPDWCEARTKRPFAPRSGEAPEPTSVGALRPGVSDIVTFWDYDIGLTVAFWGAPTYGTARFPITDGAHIATVVDRQPVAFENITAEKILAMPISVTRFRAPGDSVDLLLLAQAPLAAIREAAPNAKVRADAWLLGRNGAGDFRDSTVLAPSGVDRELYRVIPERYLFRVEATAPGAMIAGRAMRWITADRDTVTGFTLRGFGISDLLLAPAVQPAKRAPVRWSDFNVAPLLGSLPKQRTMDVIWENYELGARNGQTQYSVAITFQRQRSAAGRIAATIVGVAASAVGIDRASDRLTLRFDRAGPAAPGAFVDRISIALGDTPAGDYLLTLEVTDKVSGRKASSSTAITIRD